jgi:hypothetical protein
MLGYAGVHPQMNVRAAVPINGRKRCTQRSTVLPATTRPRSANHATTSASRRRECREWHTVRASTGSGKAWCVQARVERAGARWVKRRPQACRHRPTWHVSSGVPQGCLSHECSMACEPAPRMKIMCGILVGGTAYVMKSATIWCTRARTRI